MAGYYLSTSKWIAGSLRQYPFHYNAGLCYSSFQTSNCLVLLTFIDMPYFKWKHNTEVRRRFWDSQDPRWSQRGKLLLKLLNAKHVWEKEEKKKRPKHLPGAIIRKFLFCIYFCVLFLKEQSHLQNSPGPTSHLHQHHFLLHPLRKKEEYSKTGAKKHTNTN